MQLDLTTFVGFNESTTLVDGALVAGPEGGEFTIPAAHIADPSSHYAITITYDTLPASGYLELYSLLGPTLEGYAGASWWFLGSPTSTGIGGGPGAGTATINIGPGVEDFDRMVDQSADRYLIFYVSPGVRITGITFDPVTLPRGPWVSPGNYVNITSPSSALPRALDEESTRGSDSQTFRVPAPGDHIPIEPATSGGGIDNANRDNDGGTGESVGSAVHISYNYDGDIVNGDRVSTMRATHNFNPRAIVGADEYAPPSMPEGAIGYEWQDGTTGDVHLTAPIAARVLGTSVVSLMDVDDTDAHLYDGYAWEPGTTTQVWVNTSVDIVDGELLALPSVDVTESGETYAANHMIGTFTREADRRFDSIAVRNSPLHIPLADLADTDDGTFDLTPVLDAARREDGTVELALYTRTDTYAPRGNAGGVVATEASGRARVGGSFVGLMQVEWTFVAPTFRWIYKDSLTVPYRRTSHRHDSLAGGATRNYPPSRALQTSNRIGGGYL